MSTWQVFFPESVRVLDRWLCDVTVFNGAEKFVVTVTYDKSVTECLPQLRAAIAKRDAVTLKPAAPIAPGTMIDLTEPPAVAVPPTKDEELRAAFFVDLRAFRLQQRLDDLSPELRQRAIDLGAEGMV